ncbi:ABC transporter ATP-binding protein [Clostridiales bacterium COT073_COT-073]|nr:ABC transporter ATP-binding protein [Clostridiales bacterium COT073_COT-073]
MIEVIGVTKKYDDFVALSDVSLSVKKGSVYGLVGANGSGKTTLIKTIMGVFRQERGEITMDGQQIYNNPQVKNRIFYVPDDLFFFSMYSVKRMAKFFAGIYSDFDWERYHKIKEILKINENKRINQLSKGMKKQAILWLGICVKPDMMILDEPVDGLDPVMRRQIWSLLMQDVSTREMTVLVSSHNLRELEDICDTVGILHLGKVLLQRELDDLKGDIHKVQIAFAEENPEMDFAVFPLRILKSSRTGRVFSFVIRGKEEEIEQAFAAYQPMFIDFIPLSLEEIFIYEIGGEGYEIQNILL